MPRSSGLNDSTYFWTPDRSSCPTAAPQTKSTTRCTRIIRGSGCGSGTGSEHRAFHRPEINNDYRGAFPFPTSAFFAVAGVLDYPLRRFIIVVALGRAIRSGAIAAIAFHYGRRFVVGLQHP